MQELPLAYRRYAAALGAAGVVVVVALAFTGLPTVDPALVAVVLTGALCLHPRVVQSSERSAISLNHLPILAAVLVCPPVVAPALGGLLAAIDNRAYGRYVVWSNGGGVAVAAAAAVGTAHGAWALGLPSDAGEAGWFFGAALAAAAFFAANHLLVSGMIALKYGEPPLAVWRRCLKPMVGADLIGSTILIAFVNLVQGVDGAAVKAAAAGIGAVAVGMLLVLIARSRQMAEALAAREEAVAEREAAVAAREEALAESARSRDLAQAAKGRLTDVAAGTVPGLVSLVDLRDRYTARHSAAVGRLCRLL
ncbi:MAG TPA: hypothetical protein VL422_10990, partial [Miltoncostaea sp.]|nr:hypothetical protein [Miltoncostaea sp.]